MSKHTVVAPEAEVSSLDALLPPTRGSVRQQSKQRQRMARLEGSPLIVGLDLAQTRQAVTFAHRGQHLGRKRIDCPPSQLAAALQPVIERAYAQTGAERVLIGMEPAGYFWQLAAESFEAADLEYVLLHTISIKREREATRFTPEKVDPRDADLACSLVENGRFMEARLPVCARRAALDALAREYMLLRRDSAAELTRMKAFWYRVLPEMGDVLADVNGVTATAMSRALVPFSEMAALSLDEWMARVRSHAGRRRILTSAVAALLDHVRGAHASPHRRSGEGMPLRIAMAAERRCLLEQQKKQTAEMLLARYLDFDEAALLDSIPGSSPLYNAITLGLVGDFRHYDSSRAVVKLAGSEINEYASGEWRGRSRISHRGRSLLRAAAYIQVQNMVRGSDVFRGRFLRLQERLAKRQARVAIANSYLRTAHALVSRGEPWRDDTASARR